MITRNLKIRKVFHSKEGFSLVEAMIVMALFSFVLAGVYFSMEVGQRSWQVNEARVEVQEELRKGMDFLIYELRQTGVNGIIDLAEDGTSITFSLPSSVSSSGSIVWNSASPVTIAVTNDGTENLVRTQAGVSRVLARNISDVDFVQNGDSLDITLSAQEASANGPMFTRSFNVIVQLRN